MGKGTYFEFEYFIETNETKDEINPIKLTSPTYQKHRIDDQASFIGIDGYSRWFYNDELIKIDGIYVYLSKDTLSYEYVPNKIFNYFTNDNWDIDDFGDTDEGWDNYLEAMENQSDFEYEIQKVRYVGVILSEDKGKVESILNDLEEEFYRENEIQ